MTSLTPRGPTPAPAAADDGWQVQLLSASLTSRLAAAAERAGASLRETLVAAWSLLLHAYTSQEQVCVHVCLPRMGGRSEAATAIGSVPVRSRPEVAKPFDGFVREVKQVLREAPAVLAGIGGESGERPDGPLVAFDYDECGRGDVLEPLLHPLAGVDMALRCRRSGESLAVIFEYDAARLDETTVGSLKQGLCRILEQAADDPASPLGRIDVLTDADARTILKVFNDTSAPYDGLATLHGLFERQAAATPDAEALLAGDRCLSYRELNARANQLAGRLRTLGVAANSIVAVLLERSIEMMIGVLAILKAGGAYLPLAPDLPPARRGRILADSRAVALLTTRALSRDMPEREGLVPLDDDTVWSGPDANLASASGPRDLAYVIYTSGSTGEPKGVMIEHTSVVNRLNWMQKRYPLGRDDTLLQKTPYGFDVSVWELFWWALAGARLCLLRPGEEKDPDRLSETVQRHRVTVVHFVPSMLGAFLEHVASRGETAVSRLRSLRQVFASGEALQTAHVREFRRLLQAANGTRLTNLYGPTEATVDVSYYDCGEEAGASVPIGKPIDNTALLVLGPSGRLQPVGFSGELCIAGVGLARGYLFNPGLTAEKFVDVRDLPWSRTAGIERVYRTGDLARWRSDGNIEYLGRMDCQVKIRGFRVELGEIEAHLLEHPAVREAAAVVRAAEGSVLCAYYVPRREVAEAELRAFLADRVPDYMVPSFYVRLEALPLTASGKIDRKALPPPAKRDRAWVEPRNDVERLLAREWRDILGLSSVGAQDHFFDLGGDSIKAIQLLARLQTHGLHATTNDVYAHPTIEALARRLTPAAGPAGNVATGGREARPPLRVEDLPALEQGIQAQRSACEHAILTRPVERTFAPSAIQRGQLRVTFPLSVGVLPFYESIDKAALDRAFTRLVARHGFLRSALVRDGRRLEWREHAAPAALQLPALDVSDRAVDRSLLKELVNRLSVDDLRRPGLVYKAMWIKLDERESYLVLACHHTIHDQTCTEILKRELMHFYNGPAEELPQPEPYTEYIRLLERGPIGVDEEGLIEAFDLSEYRLVRRQVETLFAGSGRAATTYHVHKVPFQDPLQRERSFQLSYLIVNGFLSRYLRLQRIPMKILYNGRSYHDRTFLDTIGEFIDFVPVLVDVRGGSAAMLEDASRKIRFASRRNVNFMSLFMDDALRRRWAGVYGCLRPDHINWNDMTVVFNFLGIGEPLEVERFADLYERAGESPQEVVPGVSSFYCEVHVTPDDLYLFFQIKREQDPAQLRRLLEEATQEALSQAVALA